MSAPTSKVEAAYNRRGREPGAPYWSELTPRERDRLQRMWLAGAEDACNDLVARVGSKMKQTPEPVS